MNHTESDLDFQAHVSRPKAKNIRSYFPNQNPIRNSIPSKSGRDIPIFSSLFLVPFALFALSIAIFCPRLFRSRSISHGFRNQIGISVCRREPSDGGERARLQMVPKRLFFYFRLLLFSKRGQKKNNAQNGKDYAAENWKTDHAPRSLSPT